MRALSIVFLVALATLSAAWMFAEDKPLAHFHHIHLNSTDPAAAVAFYTSKFDCERGKYQDADAVWAQKSWLLFNKVSEPPPSDWLSAVWHFGWGAEDLPAEYRRQLDLGTKFQTPLTDISKLAMTNGFFYAYVDGPDHALIELNTAPHHRFGHIHLFSDDPVAAGEWYEKHFGAVRRNRSPSREPRFYNGHQVGPASSLTMDNVNIIIYPVGYLQVGVPETWKKRKGFESTRGRVVDHVAFSVDSLADTKARLKAEGVAVREDGFVEGPDRLAIELVGK